MGDSKDKKKGGETYNPDKLKEVLHFIIHKCWQLENVGKTVLFKLLYFSDFDHYELYEKSITGETYKKLPFGPAPSHFDKIITELIKEKKVRKIGTQFRGKDQQKFICLQEPKLSQLSAEEIQVVDKVISRLASMNATQISAYSHGDMPWKSAKDGEVLDYEMVFYRSDTYGVREYGNKAAQ